MHLGRTVDWVLLAVVSAHCLAAPFTKVEESLNAQAVHDVLYHRGDTAQYDHVEFPGVVPRSFAGAVALAAAASPVVALLHSLHLPKLYAFRAVRLVLGAAVTASFARLRGALSSVLGDGVGDAFVVLTAVQFHLPFYASRPLPNTFALALTNLALADWLSRRHPLRAVYLLVFATAVLRADAVLLLAPVGLHLLATRQLSLAQATGHGLAALALSLCLTLPLDGYLWGRPVWPEASSVGFNLVQGRAAEWGLSPWHWYATSALPRALLAALPLAPAGWVVERRVRPLLGCGLLYVALYSLVGHKELRFLFPALPLFNAAAAPALARAARDRGRRPVAFVAACLLLGATLGAKALLAAAAAHNYPGGWALRAAAEALGGGGGMRLHVAVGAAQTGVTRFGHPSAWSVSKAEGLTDAQLAGAGYTHLLSDRGDVPGFERLAATHGFTRFAPAPRTPWRPLRLLTEPRVYLHRRLAQGEEGGEDDVTPGSSA